ncbi:MAG: Rieske (2Fe-2S) protein [Acidobacteriaceae bacterium]|nr:Rieske (2Fe-2S) protein [Acidobacteriaceae bacterium]
MSDAESTRQTGLNIKRRQFLNGIVWGLGSLIFGALSGSAGAYLLAGAGKEHREEWTDAGDLPELRPGVPQEITFEQSRVDGWKVRNEKASAWVVLDNNGSLAAFSPLCTHLGCAYQWSAQQKQFSCPCHGSKFSVTGAVISGPAARSLDRYPTKLEGSRVWLGPVQVSRASD